MRYLPLKFQAMILRWWMFYTCPKHKNPNIEASVRLHQINVLKISFIQACRLIDKQEMKG